MSPSVHVVEIASLPARRAPISNGPTVRAVPGIGGTGSDGAGPLAGVGAAVLQVSLPAGAGMPEHDLGPSAVTLITLSGRVQLGHHDDQRELYPGTIASIGIGERRGSSETRCPV